MPVRVVAELLDDGDAELLARCAEDFLNLDPADNREVYARPLGRKGYTNSRLYRVFFQPGRRGLAFVVKTDVQEQMQREWEGCRRLIGSFPGAEAVAPFPRGGACRALVYRLIAPRGGEGSDVIELTDIAYQPNVPAGLPTSDVVIERLYGHLANAHMGPEREIEFGAEYEWYLREKSTNPRLLDPLTDIFGSDVGAEVSFDGVTIRNPRCILDRVKELRSETLVTPVHGDLHPNNVLINEDGAPAVIDFAFGQNEAHWIKDFVLMECSLRFLLPPRLLNPDVMARVDEALLDERGAGEVRDLARSQRGRTAAVLTEMADLVDAVRRRCRERHPSYDFSEYLTAQYLMLIGLLRLPTYQDLRALRFTARLAGCIEATL